jgi:hypothetical protein
MPVITVQGTATSQTVSEARGVKYIKLWETYIGYNNLEKKRLWTCWFDSEIHNETGEDFIIEGDLSCKVGSYRNKATNEDQAVVEYHLNNCVIQFRSSQLPRVAPATQDYETTPF